MQLQEMIASHPSAKGTADPAWIRCIEECSACALTCLSCADACAAEDMVKELRQCIRLNLDCADICAAAAKVATRRTGSNDPVIRQLVDLCANACRACGDECEKHAGRHQHCRICADACRRCEHACRAITTN